MNILDSDILECALTGGAFLGGGGGASMEMGRQAGSAALALGQVTMITVDDLAPDTPVVTTSIVGAPASPECHVNTRDYIRTVQLLQQNTDQPIGGIITNENGGGATINGWIQAAALAVPLIDAPCNGRAHPTGLMGGMGLHREKNYPSLQAFAGGNPDTGRYTEGFLKGGLKPVSELVRMAAVKAGGLVAVARNPIPAGHVKQHGAPGGITHAIETGAVFLQNRSHGPEKAVGRTAEFLGGKILGSGKVKTLHLVSDGGFDSGHLTVDGLHLTFWNEYMTVENDGKRLFTFPDLITTCDGMTGLPVSSAEISEDQQVIVVATRKENLKLGSTMRDHQLLRRIEPVIGKEIVIR